MRIITVGKNEAGQRLDKLLAKVLKQAPKSFLYKMLRKKNILLNKKRAEGSEIIEFGDEVTLYLSEETIINFEGDKKKEEKCTADIQKNLLFREVAVLYEDNDILMVYKPAGVLSQKAEAADLSINEWVIAYCNADTKYEDQHTETFRPAVCNRLDRNTSGIVLAGKSLPGLQLLSKLLKERAVQKYYRCIVSGVIDQEIRLTGYQHKDEVNNRVTVLTQSEWEQKGKPADFDRIMAVYTPICKNGSYTLLEVELITGKTHQIRAQLAHMGYPLIGDSKYGNASVNRKFMEQFGLRHHLLHAYRVVFPKMEEPFAAVSMREVKAPYPKLFDKIQKALFTDAK